MSGGHFDYHQYRIREIAESVEDIIQNYKYSPEVLEKIKEGLDALKKAEIYTQRIDWLVSGDDGPETFLERLKEDLSG
jgi:DNA repair ATPase RecN